ncbi:MAG: hypothetical protein Q4E13_03520 [Clostridia bacterium]|nr:hypothetical protein [Clostridia bacterium]
MKRKKNRRFGGVALTLVVAALLVAMLGIGAFQIETTADQQEIELVQQAVMRCIGSCYSIEGRYPESLDYLKQYYGLNYDEGRFIVRYDAFAVNQLPDVAVLVRGAQ